MWGSFRGKKELTPYFGCKGLFRDKIDFQQHYLWLEGAFKEISPPPGIIVGGGILEAKRNLPPALFLVRGGFLESKRTSPLVEVTRLGGGAFSRQREPFLRII